MKLRSVQSCMFCLSIHLQPSVRFEACRGLYRLSLIKENSCLTQLMDTLLEFLPLAQSLRSRDTSNGRHMEPCAREYFAILCRLVDGLPSKDEGCKVLCLLLLSFSYCFLADPLLGNQLKV